MDEAPLEEAIEGFGARLRSVGADQWGEPTPCAEWDVRALVNHVAGELLWMPPLLAGQTIAEVGDRFDGDVLGQDPLGTWERAAAEVAAAVREPGAQDRTVHLSSGDAPAGDYVTQVSADLVIHAWDLARGIEVDDELSPRLVEFAAAFFDSQIEVWRSGGAFGPEVELDEGASEQDRLLARTGRSPRWTKG